MFTPWRGSIPSFLSGPVEPGDRAPEQSGVVTTQTRTLGLIPGSNSWRKRVHALKPETCTKLSLVRAPVALKRQTTAWARRFKIAPHGHNAPEVRAMAAGLFTFEGATELRAQLNDLLGSCAQAYVDHSPGHKAQWPVVRLFKDSCYNEFGALVSPTTMDRDDFVHAKKPVIQTTNAPILWNAGLGYQGWLLYLGVTESDEQVHVHTHLGVSSFEGDISQYKEWFGEQGLPVIPPIMSDMERDRLRFIMELFTFAHEELTGFPEPLWSLYEDGSLDLNLYGESQDELTLSLAEHERRQNQIARRYIERVEAEEEATQLAQDRDYVPFWEAGSQDDEPEELLWGATPLRKASAKDKTLSKRENIRIGDMKDLQIVQFMEHHGDTVKVDVLCDLRAEKTFTKKGDDGVEFDITYNPWNVDVLRKAWCTVHQNKRGDIYYKGHPDLTLMFSQAAYTGLESEQCAVSLQSKVESAVYTRTDPETGEVVNVPNRFIHSRWINYPGAPEKIHPVGMNRKRFVSPHGFTWFWARCPKGHGTSGRKAANGKYESPFREEAHADVCLFCREQGTWEKEWPQVKGFVYLPIHWFADIIDLAAFAPPEGEGEPFKRDGYYDPPKADVFVRVPFYGEHVKHIMKRELHGASIHSYHGPDEDGFTRILEPDVLHPQMEDYTYQSYSNGLLSPRGPRGETMYVDPAGRRHVMVDGNDWFDDVEGGDVEGANSALHSLRDKLRRMKLRRGSWNPKAHGWKLWPAAPEGEPEGEAGQYSYDGTLDSLISYWMTKGGVVSHDTSIIHALSIMDQASFNHHVSMMARHWRVSPSNLLDLLLERFGSL